LAEEFGCLPSAALAEWQRAPAGLLEEIIEMRAFAAAKQIVDSAQRRQDIPRTPMCQLVQRIEFELVQAQVDVDAKRQANDGR
jgi:hypothetical protein